MNDFSNHQKALIIHQVILKYENTLFIKSVPFLNDCQNDFKDFRQDFFINLYKRKGATFELLELALNNDSHGRQWFFKCAKNFLIDTFRKKKSRNKIHSESCLREEELNEESAILAKLQFDKIREMVTKIPKKDQKQYFELWTEDYRDADIAIIMNKSRTNIAYIKKKVFEWIKDQLSEDKSAGERITKN